MNEQLLIKNIAEIGKLLLKNGAEIYRVEESLERMCQSYGFQDIGVFALPTYFTMSVTFQEQVLLLLKELYKIVQTLMLFVL